MRTPTLKSLLTAALAGACLGPAAVALAQDEAPSQGLVRISDQPAAKLEPVPDPGPQGVVHTAGPGAIHPHPPAPPLRSQSPLLTMLGPGDGCTYPPDYGWNRPVKRRMYNQVPVQYYRYWPDVWYGTPGAFTNIPVFPQVYTPTDTTQLGYYYQRVPTWQPSPGMLPPPPWPAHWHRRECPESGYPYTAPPGTLIGAPLAARPVPPGPPPVAAPLTPADPPPAVDTPAPPDVETQDLNTSAQLPRPQLRLQR